MGGGQENALTGQFYVINQDPALKAVQEKFPNMDIKAIQDDITIFKCGRQSYPRRHNYFW